MEEKVELQRLWRCSPKDYGYEEEQITGSVEVLRDQTAVCKKSMDWPCVTGKLRKPLTCHPIEVL
jgi:hypothetical protein